MPAHRFVVVDTLAAPQPFEDRWFLVDPVTRNENGDRSANDFTCRVPKKPLGPPVPAFDDPGEILAYDRIVRRLDNRG